MKDLFYKPVKINAKDEDILVWGCPHWGHECLRWATPLWKMRGFSSLDDHDLSLINKWNLKASEETVGFLLGDLAFGKDAEKNLLHILNRLYYKEIYLLFGNHHAGVRQLFEKCEGNKMMIGNKKVIFTPNYLEAFINGQPVVYSHYPLLSWNGQGKGSFMLYSHVHGKLEQSDLGKRYVNSGCRSLEMSVEKWPAPASFREIKNILLKREAVSFDGHNQDTQNPF